MTRAALTAPRAVAPATSWTGGQPDRRRLIAVLAGTQTIGYGVLYYAFAVLLTPIAADLGAPTAAVTGALTISILVAAAAAVPVGRWLDRHGGRLLMTAGSMLGAAAVAGWSQVHELWQLYAVFALVGLGGAMSLYEAAFAVIVAVTEPARRTQALLAVTIVAGFASSIFFPLTGWLLRLGDWRTAVLALAVLLAVTAVPGHVIAIPGRARFQALRNRQSGAGVRAALLDRTFWLYAVAFVIHAAAVATVGVLLVAYLQYRGHPAAVAATVAGLLGVLSVAGRLIASALARRHGMVAITAAVFAVQALGAAALPALSESVGGAAVCVTAFGLGFGVATIARPAMPQ